MLLRSSDVQGVGFAHQFTGIDYPIADDDIIWGTVYEDTQAGSSSLKGLGVQLPEYGFGIPLRRLIESLSFTHNYLFLVCLHTFYDS